MVASTPCTQALLLGLEALIGGQKLFPRPAALTRKRAIRMRSLVMAQEKVRCSVAFIGSITAGR